MADVGREVTARVVLQQCLYAKLQVKPPNQDSEAEWVECKPPPLRCGIWSWDRTAHNKGQSSYCENNESPAPLTGFSGFSLCSLKIVPLCDPSGQSFCFQIQKGMVVYVCFFKGADDAVIPKMVSSLVNVKLSESDSGKRVSILDLPGSILIVPQATLGGKVKGRCMQYHTNADKEHGMNLYAQLLSQCQQELEAHPKWAESGAVLKFGTYGNRQVLQLNTNGPYTHLLEF